MICALYCVAASVPPRERGTVWRRRRLFDTAMMAISCVAVPTKELRFIGVESVACGCFSL